MAAKKRAPRKAAQPADAERVTPDPKATTFAPLEAPSGTELSDKERAEQTQFKPLRKDDE